MYDNPNRRVPGPWHFKNSAVLNPRQQPQIKDRNYGLHKNKRQKKQVFGYGFRITLCPGKMRKVSDEILKKEMWSKGKMDGQSHSGWKVMANDRGDVYKRQVFIITYVWPIYLMTVFEDMLGTSVHQCKH